MGDHHGSMVATGHPSNEVLDEQERGVMMTGFLTHRLCYVATVPVAVRN